MPRQLQMRTYQCMHHSITSNVLTWKSGKNMQSQIIILTKPGHVVSKTINSHTNVTDKAPKHWTSFDIIKWTIFNIVFKVKNQAITKCMVFIVTPENSWLDRVIDTNLLSLCNIKTSNYVHSPPHPPSLCFLPSTNNTSACMHKHKHHQKQHAHIRGLKVAQGIWTKDSNHSSAIGASGARVLLGGGGGGETKSVGKTQS